MNEEEFRPTFPTRSRTLSEASSPPDERRLGVERQVGARRDSRVPVGRRASRTGAVGRPSVLGGRNKHGGGGGRERGARERRRSREGVFYGHRQRTCRVDQREDRNDGGGEGRAGGGGRSDEEGKKKTNQHSRLTT